MKRLLLKIRPLTAFGSELKGGMLFGQLCCVIKLLYGEERLKALLENYCQGQPFAVISDALPTGMLPMPTIPGSFWIPASSTQAERKRWKKMRWLEADALELAPAQWHQYAKSNADLAAKTSRLVLSHNTIRRDTLTTGTGQFAPYEKEPVFYSRDAELDVHIVCDDARLSIDELTEAFQALGCIGFGADASAGLGKFELTDCRQQLDAQACSRRFLALSACAPQGGAALPSSYYKTTTYFGRHGAERVFGLSPFKRPLLMADAGAVFDCGKPQCLAFIGQGISGHSVYSDTVHQGYAVVLGLKLWCEESTHAE